MNPKELYFVTSWFIVMDYGYRTESIKAALWRKKKKNKKIYWYVNFWRKTIDTRIWKVVWAYMLAIALTLCLWMSNILTSLRPCLI